jgi:hypothetical protein
MFITIGEGFGTWFIPLPPLCFKVVSFYNRQLNFSFVLANVTNI